MPTNVFELAHTELLKSLELARDQLRRCAHLARARSLWDGEAWYELSQELTAYERTLGERLTQIQREN